MSPTTKLVLFAAAALASGEAAALAQNVPVCITSGTGAAGCVGATAGAPLFTQPGTGALSNVNVTQWGSASTTQGQATMAASIPVVVASNQSNLPVQGAAANGSPVSGNPVLLAGSDGTNASTLRTGSATNLAAQTALGSQVFTVPGNWSVLSSATAGTPSAVRAAGGAGVRHVANCVSISIAAGTTVQTPVLVNLRDGASGAGTIVGQWTVAAAVSSAGSDISLCGLGIVGSAATAMTLEYAGATATGVQAAVTLSGYDTQ